MKPTAISEIRAESREEFEKKFVIKPEDDFPFVGYQDHDLGRDFWRADIVQSFLSSAEDRLLQGIVEKIEGMEILTNHPVSYSAKIIHGERAEGLEEGYNRALADLKSYIDEGRK